MSGVVAHIPNAGPKFVPVSTEILARCATEVVAYVRIALANAIGIEDEDDFRLMFAERDLCGEDDVCGDRETAFKEKLESGKPTIVRVLFRLLGGKGGFGALLRKQAKMGKKVKNFDAMRDLTGCRLRHSTAVDRIKQWMEKQKAEDDLVNAIRGEGPELPKVAPASEMLDPEFVRKLKRSAIERPAVVTEGLRKLEAEEQEPAKRVRADKGSSSSSAGLFGAMTSLGDISSPSADGESSEEAEDTQASAAAAAPASSAAAGASSAAAAAKPEEKDAAAPAAAPVSNASAIAEAIAESFCAATEKDETDGDASQRVRSRGGRGTGGAASAEVAEAVECLGAKDMAKFKDANALLAKVSAETLKQSLQKLGLKCGGTPKDRAERLFQLKDKKLEDLPKKDFAK